MEGREQRVETFTVPRRKNIMQGVESAILAFDGRLAWLDNVEADDCKKHAVNNDEQVCIHKILEKLRMVCMVSSICFPFGNPSLIYHFNPDIKNLGIVV